MQGFEYDWVGLLVADEVAAIGVFPAVGYQSAPLDNPDARLAVVCKYLVPHRRSGLAECGSARIG